MAAKAWLGQRSRVEYLKRLSVVYAVELRLRIVIELYMREMSPKQFYEEFGGGSATRVSQNFRKLTDKGWLRYVRTEGPGGKHRGAEEHFYRATELPIFDYETWRLLPYSMRAAFSWTILKQLAERWHDALKLGTFALRPDHHASCTVLRLDQTGWERVIAAIDSLFVSLFEEQQNARLRTSRSGEALMTATVVLTGFESPSPEHERIGPTLPVLDSPYPFSKRVASLLADELALEIVKVANEGIVGTKLLSAELGVDAGVIRGRIKRLVEIGWLQQVEQKTGGRLRGAVEKFYLATGPVMHPWAVEDEVRGMEAWQLFEHISDRAKASMITGTFDARADRYLTWSLLKLDEQGWRWVASAVQKLLAHCQEEQQSAEARIAGTAEEPIAMTLALAAFEAAPNAARES